MTVTTDYVNRPPIIPWGSSCMDKNYNSSKNNHTKYIFPNITPSLPCHRLDVLAYMYITGDTVFCFRNCYFTRVNR